MALGGTSRDSAPTKQTCVLGASVTSKGSTILPPLRGVASLDCPKQKGVNIDNFLQPTDQCAACTAPDVRSEGAFVLCPVQRGGTQFTEGALGCGIACEL